MKIEEFKKNFPITIKASVWNILFADKWDVTDCVGARTLKKALKKTGYQFDNVLWAVYDGNALVCGERIHFHSYKINLMRLSIFKRKVTFNVQEI